MADRCKRCGDWLSSYDDDFDICGLCGEAEYLNSKARREWEEFHPGEPCPDIELPFPPPQTEGR